MVEGQKYSCDPTSLNVTLSCFTFPLPMDDLHIPRKQAAALYTATIRYSLVLLGPYEHKVSKQIEAMNFTHFWSEYREQVILLATSLKPLV